MGLRSLRAHILVVASAIVVGLTAATLAYVSVLADRAVGDRIAADLARSRETLAAAEADRYRRLNLVAELVASFPELRALFATDAATIRDFLSDFRQRHGREELLIALDATGRVVARSDTFAALSVPEVQRVWLEPALGGYPPAGFLIVDERLYHATVAVAESGGTVFGFTMAASPVDHSWARTLREASDKEIVILGPSGVIGSTLATDRLPWQRAGDFPSRAPNAPPLDIDLGGEAFQAVVARGADGNPIRVISLQSRDLAFAPYRNIQLGLLVLGLAAAVVGVGGSALLARSITTPIGQLVQATRRVSEGDFDVRLSIARNDEIGDLAQSFNRMTEGLRERADMQKFVSQSTVDMIHTRQARPAERPAVARQILTVLFSDIRGFTSFASEREPEQAVQILNRYLRLQAELVRRFRGDVDKFMGDAVFAHFSGPDQALDAIRCAVEIQRAIGAASRNDPDLPPLAVGIGIATGEVIVGSIGSDDRLDYTPVGAAVNLGSRLCASAERQEILLSEDTFVRVKDLVAAEATPPFGVKGLSAPVRAYRMTVA